MITWTFGQTKRLFTALRPKCPLYQHLLAVSGATGLITLPSRRSSLLHPRAAWSDIPRVQLFARCLQTPSYTDSDRAVWKTRTCGTLNSDEASSRTLKNRVCAPGLCTWLPMVTVSILPENDAFLGKVWKRSDVSLNQLAL